MQISTNIFSKTSAIKIPLQNPSKIKKIYFEDIIQENLLQYLSDQCWNQLQSMHKFEENWKQYFWEKSKGKKIIKETSRGGRMGFLDRVLEEQTYSKHSFLFLFIILLFCLRMEG